MKYIVTLLSLALATSLSAQTLIDLDFSTDTSSTWFTAGNAGGADSSISYNSTGGNGGGALELSALNAEEIGKAYIFGLNTAVSPLSGADLNVSFDVKTVGALPGTAVHFESHDPVSPVQVFDLQAKGLNDATWTTFTTTIAAPDAGKTNIQLMFNLAAGAFSGAGGTLLVDNISVTQVPEPSTFAAIFGVVALAFVAIKRRK